MLRTSLYGAGEARSRPLSSCGPHCELGPVLKCKSMKGTATDQQGGPHTLPCDHRLLQEESCFSFPRGSFPIKHPGHGMNDSRTLSSCSRIMGALKGQLWRAGLGRPEQGEGEAPACLPCTPVSTHSPSFLQCPCYPAGCGRCSSH